MGAGAGDVDSQRELIAKRVEFVELLEERDALDPRDFVTELDCSRSTVTRALGELRDADLVTKTDTGYNATAVAVMLATEYRRHEAATRAMLEAKPVLDSLDGSDSPDAAFLVESEYELATEAAPFRPIERIAEQLCDAQEIHAYLPTLVTPSLLDVLEERVVNASIKTDVVFDARLFDELRGQYPRLLGRLAASESFTASTVQGREYALFVTEHATGPRCVLVAYDTGTRVVGSIHNDTDAAISWAQSAYAEITDAATEATAELERNQAVVTDGSQVARARNETRNGANPSSDDQVDRRLPVALRRAGFEEVVQAGREPVSVLDPAVSWQTEFSLAEVRAGHAVPRLTEDGKSFTDRIIDVLNDGDNRALLGPPGSGKSVICKAVASEWANRDHGPVVYREWGSGDGFDDPALLEAYLRERDGHALVVVEDAVRQPARAIFEVMERVGARDDISFLLDARRNEWNDSDPRLIDGRRDAYRRHEIETTSVPAFDRADCERFVDQYEALTEARLALTGEDLHDVLSEAESTERPANRETGGALLAGHLVTRYADADDIDVLAPRTELHDEVRRVLDALSESEGSLAVDVAVLACALTAAGVPVTKEYLHSLATAEGVMLDDVATALEAIEGEVVFERKTTGGTFEYRTRHTQWVLAFLERYLDATPKQEARDRFGHSITRLLALADEPDARNRIKRYLDGQTAHLHRIDPDATAWATEVTERIFDLGRTYSDLTPLYGTTQESPLDLPEACRDRLQYEQANWRGWMYGRQGQHEAADREFSHLLQASTADDDLDQSTVDYLRLLGKHGKGGIATEKRELENALELLQDTVVLAANLGRHRLILSTWITVSGLYFSRQEYDQARRYLGRIRSLAAHQGFEQLEAAGRAGLGLIDSLEGDVDQAKERLETAIENLGGDVDGHNRVNAHGNLAGILQQQNEVDAAAEHYNRALELARREGVVPLEANWLLSLASFELYQGNYDAARGYATNAHSLAEQINSPWHIPNCHNRLGEIALATGETTAAANHADDALEVIDTAIRPETASGTHILRGRVALRNGNVAAAVDAFERALALAEERANPKPIANCERWLAHVALEDERPTEAEQRARAALKQYRDWKYCSRIADCEGILAAAAIQRGAAEEAAAHLGAARDALPADAAPQVHDRIDDTAARLEAGD